MTSIYSYAWTTDFVVPDPVSNLAIAADLDAIALVPSWDASADDYHYEYVVDAQSRDGVWTEIGRTTALSLVYGLAPQNVDVRIRVRDSNGSQYSDPVEIVGTLAFALWSLTNTDGDGNFVSPLEWVQRDPSVDLPLDLVSIDPLSGSAGDTQFPIVFVGQWRGERISLSLLVPSDDQALLDMLRAAVRERPGKIAIKSPDGDVWLVQFGAQTQTRTDGFVVASCSATRIA